MRQDISAMALTTTEPLTAFITTNPAGSVNFSLGAAACLDIRRHDDTPVRSNGSDRVEVRLRPGEQFVTFAPCR